LFYRSIKRIFKAVYRELFIRRISLKLSDRDKSFLFPLKLHRNATVSKSLDRIRIKVNLNYFSIKSEYKSK